MYIYIYTRGSSWLPFDFCDISLSGSSSIFSFASSASWKSGRRQSGFQQHDHLVPLLQNKLKIEIFKMRIKKWALRLPRCLSCWNLIFHQALGPCHDCCLYSRSALSEHPTSLRTHEHPWWHGFRFRIQWLPTVSEASENRRLSLESSEPKRCDTPNSSRYWVKEHPIAKGNKRFHLPFPSRGAQSGRSCPAQSALWFWPSAPWTSAQYSWVGLSKSVLPYYCIKSLRQLCNFCSTTCVLAVLSL